MKKIKLFIAALAFCAIAKSSFGQDSRILIGLDDPAYGVKILSKFPNGSGGFARGYIIANQDNSENYIQLGAYGSYFGGVSTLTYSYIGREYNQAYMVFRPNGNVGIGTANPLAKLAVDGNILAKEIRIKTDIAVPDYVFEPDYNLKSLEEIQSYIKENKHLPEIPSAKQIQSEGLDLAEMNLLLLKKMEEMTLHMIQLNNTVIKQSEEIKTQANQIKSLQKKGKKR